MPRPSHIISDCRVGRGQTRGENTSDIHPKNLKKIFINHVTKTQYLKIVEGLFQSRKLLLCWDIVVVLLVMLLVWRNIMNCTRTVQNVTKITFFEVADNQQ